MKPHRFTLAHLSSLVSQVEVAFNIDCDDWGIETFFLFEDEDIPVGALALPEQMVIIFTDSPNTAAAKFYGFELVPEARDITWAMIYLNK